MPHINVKALERIMLRQNMLFKHQIINQVGIPYERLTAIIANHENEVEEEIVKRLCSGLGCKREEIIIAPKDP